MGNVIHVDRLLTDQECAELKARWMSQGPRNAYRVKFIDDDVPLRRRVALRVRLWLARRRCARHFLPGGSVSKEWLARNRLTREQSNILSLNWREEQDRLDVWAFWERIPVLGWLMRRFYA